MKINASKIAKYGRMRLGFIKYERKDLYTQLLFSAGLEEHLLEINETAQNQVRLLMKQLVKAQGITEELKAQNQMEWVGKMNNIKAQAEEIIFNTLIRE